MNRIPSYRTKNIVNLMSSLLQGLGSDSASGPLEKLPPAEIQNSRNIILLVIDGLGSDSLATLPPNSFLRKNKISDLSTVFPSTTAAAITTFFTSVSPKEHGFVAWDMYMKEFGTVVQILPYRAKEKNAAPLPKKNILVPPSIFSQFKIESHIILKKKLAQSHYNSLFQSKSRFWGYQHLWGLAASIRRTMSSSPQQKFIYAYWPGFDDSSHHLGKSHPRTLQHLRRINRVIEKLAHTLQGTATLLLVTADHGQVETTRKETIILEKHPRLLACFSKPVCGEARAPFFYVHPSRRKEFEQYVNKKLGKYGTLHSSRELAQRGYFGLNMAHPSFAERIGDYILLAKGNYIFKEHLISKEHPFIPGHHGGLSKQEMTVPLVRVLL